MNIRRLTRWLAMPAALAIAPSPLTAQRADSTRPPNPFCFRGRPAQRCQRFLILEMDLRTKLARTGALLNDVQPGATGPTEIGGGVTWRLGAMRNRDDRHALGGFVEAGFVSSGADGRFAAALRRRTWIDAETARDLDMGALLLTRDGRAAVGITTAATVNARDVFSLTLNLDAAYSKRPQADVSVGLRLGSYAAIGGTAALAALVIAAAHAVSSGT